MIRTRLLAMALGAAMLSACSSAPMHYYTLVPPPDTANAPAMPPVAFQFQLLPITVPAQDDVPQLVVRQGAQSVQLLQGERWIAPLADELRGGLSAELARRMNAQDLGDGLPANGKPVVRIKVDVRRFDSAPGSYALLDASWSVHALKGDQNVTCNSHISENVGGGYDGLVAGHQAALAELAARIAQVALQVAAGASPACPAG